MEQAQRLTNTLMNRFLLELEASGRHVHVTKQQARILFGHDLTPRRDLSQPGQYLSEERVTLVGPKGEMPNVAVLGPERREAQVELSLTDGVSLGLKLPVRMSGDVAGTPGITLKGPCGTVTLTQGAMAAQRHIHLPPEDAARRGLRDGQVVKVRTLTERPVVLEQVVVRVNPQFAPRLHMDFDEANGCGFRKGDLGVILP